MQFYLFNVDSKGENEVYLHGKQLDGESTIKTIRVTNIHNPVYFRPVPGHEDALLCDISNFVVCPYQVEHVSRKNIFHRDLPRTVDLLKISFAKHVNLGGFRSTHCSLFFAEFQNPLENFMISKQIIGPGVLELAGTSKNAVDYSGVSFVASDMFPDLCVSSVVVDTAGGEISRFVYYNSAKKKFTRGVLRGCKEDVAGGESLATRLDAHGSLLAFLNEVIRNDDPDVILCHNFHLKTKINIRGRVFCDLFVFATGTVKGRDYSIQELCTIYRINRGRGLDGDAVALVDIAEAMSALPLAKELSEVSGYMLNKCLGNSRAERIEFTLLHELYSRGYLFPLATTPKANEKYAGGLVLEPSRGFYEDIVLLLDFNSLYPSIIQEFNVCFSTIGFCGSAEDGESAGQETTFLPGILSSLVKRRSVVKNLIKQTQCPKERSALEIRQKALKLTANSIYGCLGFQNSRFCNYAMASFITAKGRELLEETAEVAKDMDMRVIYGDTDSIMIHTKYPGRAEYYKKAADRAGELVEMINRKYQNIEIELEKVFKKLLLYTKKRYAALVFGGRGSYIETKGIDLVRRDFCLASTDLSRSVLNVILQDREIANDRETEENLVPETGTENNTKDTTEKIYSICMGFYATLLKRDVGDFVIASVLNRDPSAYPGGSNLPHVSLALRLREKKVIYHQDDVVSYVIGTGNGPVAARAFHPDEGHEIDYKYYIRNQILPPLFRLVSLLTYINTEKIARIFDLVDFAPKQPQNSLTFVMPCCSNVQAASNRCLQCNQPVPQQFYAEEISSMLQRAASKLYLNRGECVECARVYRNHLTVCFYCQKELKFSMANHEFDALIASIENGMGDADLPEVVMIVRGYSATSMYRVVNLRKYFPVDEVTA